MLRIRRLAALACLVLLPAAVPAPAREPAVRETKVPHWDARGVGLPPWQGVACLDVNDDATRIALGTIAPAGDPNVLLLGADGQLLRQPRAGQRWIAQVALGADDVLRAVCTMPAGRSGDIPEVFRLAADVAGRFSGLHALDTTAARPLVSRFKPEVTGPYVDVRMVDVNGDGRPDLVTSYGSVYLRGADGKLPAEPTMRLPTEKGEWHFLAVGDFNGDGRPDVVLLSYGMHGQTSARVFSNTGKADRPFGDKPDAIVPLNPQKKGDPLTLLRDSPVAAGAASAGIFSLAFRDGKHAMIVGGDYRKPDDVGATAAITSDGGKTWASLDKKLPFRSGIAWAKGRWVAVGTSGSHASPDDGDTWKVLDRENYNSVGFTPTGEGWAVGPKGRIATFAK